jgi:putative SOS response-associated peptidase YedK
MKSRALSLLRWGLIPSWVSDPTVGFKSINARSETVMTTPSFRDSFRAQRCLIPADGFYEWRRSAKFKQPYCFELNNRELFAFAGLWDRWTDGSGKTIETCAILTTSANSTIANVHDRMPVILQRGDYDDWLRDLADSSAALRLLTPYAGSMRQYPVSDRLNQVQNDDVQCSEPVKLVPSIQGDLFS